MKVREYFDHAYEGFYYTFRTFSEMIIVCIIYITIPLWVIPYSLFFRKMKGGAKMDSGESM